MPTKGNPLFNAKERQMREQALENLSQMKETEEKTKNEMITTRLKNGVIVRNTNESIIKQFEEKYGKL